MRAASKAAASKDAAAARHNSFAQALEREIRRRAPVFDAVDARAVAARHARNLRGAEDLLRAADAIEVCTAKVEGLGLTATELERELGTFIIRATDPNSMKRDNPYR